MPFEGLIVSNFDHTASHFAHTRGLPPQVADQVAEVVVEILGVRNHVLDVGIGPGRIAGPLIMRGVHLTGIDISYPMIRRMITSLSPNLSRPALVQGNALDLPFARGVFDAAITIHVLTILAGWREALSEIRRTLKPEGILFTGYEWRPPASPGRVLLAKWREMIQNEGMEIDRAGGQDIEEIKDALESMGARLEKREVGNWTTERTLAQHLEAIVHRTWSRTSDVPEDFFTSQLRKLTSWATKEFGELGQTFSIPRKFIWLISRWDG